MAKPIAPRAPLLALFLANVVLACGPWLVRVAEGGGIGPVGSAFWRLALALPFLFALGRRTGERLPAGSRPWLWLAAAGGVCFGVDLAAWHLGILRTRLANATLLANIPAILFPIYGFVAARRWPGRRQVGALLLAAAGAGLLLGRSFELSAANLHGDLLSVFAGLCYTTYLIVVERARTRLGPFWTLGVASAAGAATLAVIAIPAGETLWPHDWLPLIALSLGSQVIGQGLILLSVKRLTPLAIGLMLLVQPFGSTLIGWIRYGEQPTMGDIAGAVLLGLAIVLVRESARSQPAGGAVRQPA